MDNLTSRETHRQVFKVTQLKEGYDMKTIDSLLDKIAESLSAYETGHPEFATIRAAYLDAVDIPTARFTPVYNAGQVDDFLDRAKRTLAEYEARAASASYGAGASGGAVGSGAVGGAAGSAAGAAPTSYASQASSYASPAPMAAPDARPGYGAAAGESYGMPPRDGGAPAGSGELLLRLPIHDCTALQRMADERGESVNELVHEWVSSWSR